MPSWAIKDSTRYLGSHGFNAVPREIRDSMLFLGESVILFSTLGIVRDSTWYLGEAWILCGILGSQGFNAVSRGGLHGIICSMYVIQ